MISEYNTLDQDTKLFLDPIKTLGDIGVTLTKKDIEDAEREPNAETAEGEEGGEG